MMPTKGGVLAVGAEQLLEAIGEDAVVIGGEIAGADAADVVQGVPANMASGRPSAFCTARC